jgi:hypothetical protein
MRQRRTVGIESDNTAKGLTVHTMLLTMHLGCGTNYLSVEKIASRCCTRICIVQFAAVMTVGERIPVLQYGCITLARVPAA